VRMVVGATSEDIAIDEVSYISDVLTG
jgi:hypothetical protein